jgi:putative phage-type endonuclease
MSNPAQGTQEWLQQRLGKVTASRMADMTARTKNGYGASRANYMAQLLVERLTGQATETYTNGAMQWGTDTEPKARAAYSFITDSPVIEVGFIDHPTLPMSGASPDGLVGEDGLIEIKCPNTATHIEALLGEPVAEKYIKQIQWQMACAGKKWCDFVSFDPRLPFEMQIKIQRIAYDQGIVTELEKEAALFLGELDSKLAELQKLNAANDDMEPPPDAVKMKGAEFTSTVKNGRPGMPRSVDAMLRRMEGKPLHVVIEEPKKNRTLPQNSYWKGVLAPQFTRAMNEHGCQLTTYQADLVIKDGINYVQEVQMPDGQIKRVPRSTTECSTVEMASLVEQAIAWAATEWNITLLYPNEVQP